MILALNALTQTLSEPRRAQRFLDLTGIGTADLRDRAGDPALLASLIRFLEAHEPDLLSVCDAIGVKASELTAARRAIEDKGRA